MPKVCHKPSAHAASTLPSFREEDNSVKEVAAFAKDSKPCQFKGESS
jgi:hypothetical protein